jgi:hypothetical protein
MSVKDPPVGSAHRGEWATIEPSSARQAEGLVHATRDVASSTQTLLRERIFGILRLIMSTFSKTLWGSIFYGDNGHVKMQDAISEVQPTEESVGTIHLVTVLEYIATSHLGPTRRRLLSMLGPSCPPIVSKC